MTQSQSDAFKAPIMTDKKREVKAANDAFWERYQFILSVNDDIICQRYFRINGYNRDMPHTEEFKNVMDGCVQMIKDDLAYKSFVYLSWTHNSPLKLTGFVKEFPSESDVRTIFDDNIVGEVALSDGTVIDKTYLYQTDGNWKDEPLEAWDVTFKFQFLVDNTPIYERIWDGSQYPKYVRNSVDLSNSDAYWKNEDQSNLYFSKALLKYMTNGRKDLTWKIIRNICDITSASASDYDTIMTKKCQYGDITYAYRPYNKQYVDDWRSATSGKTRKYFINLEKNEKYKNSGGLSEGEWNYVERYL